MGRGGSGGAENGYDCESGLLSCSEVASKSWVEILAQIREVCLDLVASMELRKPLSHSLDSFYQDNFRANQLYTSSCSSAGLAALEVIQKRKVTVDYSRCRCAMYGSAIPVHALLS